jgi:hypothetical protein
MESIVIAMFLKPFVALILFGFILLPIRLFVLRIVPEGRIKRFLLFPVGTRDGEARRQWREVRAFPREVN